jgi:hypothetical protein
MKPMNTTKRLLGILALSSLTWSIQASHARAQTVSAPANPAKSEGSGTQHQPIRKPGPHVTVRFYGNIPEEIEMQALGNEGNRICARTAIPERVSDPVLFTAPDGRKGARAEWNCYGVRYSVEGLQELRRPLGIGPKAPRTSATETKVESKVPYGDPEIIMYNSAKTTCGDMFEAFLFGNFDRTDWIGESYSISPEYECRWKKEYLELRHRQ